MSFKVCQGLRKNKLLLKPQFTTLLFTILISFFFKLILLPFQDLNTRLKQLINSEEVMLFMKGTPAEPRCGRLFISWINTRVVPNLRVLLLLFHAYTVNIR